MDNRIDRKIVLTIFLIISFLISLYIITRPFKQAVPASESTTASKNDIKAVAAYPLTMLHADGNRLRNKGGDQIILKGLMPPDLKVLKSKNKFKKSFFEDMRNTGANVIRIPVHPDQYLDEDDYFNKYIVPSVDWTRELGMYAIIDLHFIGNIITGEGEQMPDIDENPHDLAISFWTKVASYFKDTPNVIFEICNEPSGIGAEEWRICADELVDLIRAQGAKQLIIVGGIQYSQDISWVKNNPVNDENIAYAAHIYPAHSIINWDGWFGEISAIKPVISTEWGFIDNRLSTKQYYLVGSEDSYGKPFLDYLDQHNIGWVACWYDDTWEPEMFKKDSMEYTKYGKFVFDRLQSLAN